MAIIVYNIKVEYVNNHTKVNIICYIHGEFMTLPYRFLQGFGCPKCSYEHMGKKQILSKEQFIEKARDECKYNKCLNKLKLLYYVDNKDYVFNENVSFIYNELNVLQKLSMLWEVL